MDKSERLAFELVGRIRVLAGKKLTDKEAKDALANLVKHANAVHAAINMESKAGITENRPF